MILAATFQPAKPRPLQNSCRGRACPCPDRRHGWRCASHAAAMNRHDASHHPGREKPAACGAPLLPSPLQSRLKHVSDSLSFVQESLSCVRESLSSMQSSLSPVRATVSPVPEPVSPVQATVSPVRRTVSPMRRTVSPMRKPLSCVRAAVSPVQEPLSPVRAGLLTRWPEPDAMPPSPSAARLPVCVISLRLLS
jgi:hypothetical protein